MEGSKPAKAKIKNEKKKITQNTILGPQFRDMEKKRNVKGQYKYRSIYNFSRGLKMEKRVEIFNEFAIKIGRVLRRTSGDKIVYVHFFIKGKSDHIILAYLHGTLTKIVVKGKECDKGECVRWNRSEFSDFSQEETLIRFIDKIEQVIIDHPVFKRSWGSLDEFLDWLTEMEN